MDWGDVLKICPYLKDLKNVFVYDKITSAEIEDKGFDTIDASSYAALPYASKKRYIELGHPLGEGFMEDTPMDLIELYIRGVNNPLTKSQKTYLSNNGKKLLDYYYHIVNERMNNDPFIKYLSSNDLSASVLMEPLKNNIIVNRIKLERWNDMTIECDVVNLFKEAESDYNSFTALEHLATTYYQYQSYNVDDDELNYIGNYLNADTVDVIKRILPILGDEYDGNIHITNEGVIKKIFEDTEYWTGIEETFIGAVAQMKEEAETKAAQKMMEKYYDLPFEIETPKEIYISDIDAFAEFMAFRAIKVTNMAEALVAVLETAEIPEYPWDEIGDRVMALEDDSGVIEAMKDKFEEILVDVELNDEGPVTRTMDSLGFVRNKKSTEVADIVVLDKFPDDTAGSDDPNILVQYQSKKTGKTEVGKIKLSSLNDYVNNYELFENVRRVNYPSAEDRWASGFIASACIFQRKWKSYFCSTRVIDSSCRCLI